MAVREDFKKNGIMEKLNIHMYKVLLLYGSREAIYILETTFLLKQEGIFLEVSKRLEPLEHSSELHVPSFLQRK